MVVHRFDIGIVMDLNLGRSKLNFLFAKIFFGMNAKGQRNPSWPRGSQEGWKTTLNDP